jgi:hypothetical protein
LTTGAGALSMARMASDRMVGLRKSLA